MSATVEKVQDWHFKAIKLQPAQAFLQESILEQGHAADVLEVGPAEAIVKDGRVLAVHGAIEFAPYRCFLWQIHTYGAPRDFVAVFRHSKAFVERLTHRRIEASARCDSPEANRFLQLLGFQREGIMRAFEHDGTDAVLWAKVGD